MPESTADDLLRRSLLEMMRDAAGRDWPRATEFEFAPTTPAATETHLTQCPDAQIHDVDADTDTTSTGTQVGQVVCTVRCPHGESAAAKAGAYGNVSFLIDRMTEHARRAIDNDECGEDARR